MNPQDGPPSAAVGWLDRRERGALLGIRAVFVLATLFGRWPARQFVRLISAWYVLFDRVARRASRDWNSRVLGRPATIRDVYRHVACFAQVTLDRIFLLQRKDRCFVTTRTGDHHLHRLVREGKGAILLGAHLGSFEAMRVGGHEEALPIRIVGNFKNARMINALLEQLDPEMAARVIHSGSDPLSFALKVRECIDAGALVAILGDRVAANEKSVEVNFFGARASFPAGPFLIAATLRCPVYLVFGLYYEPNHYALHCEPFAESVVLPRAERERALAEHVQRFATRLEEYCRKAPDNWFNFYDFWKRPAP